MRQGEIIFLGEHKLMCGDSTNSEHVNSLMHGSRAKIIFTSPPYADIYTYGGNDLSPKHLAQFIGNYKPYAEIMCVNLGIVKRNNEIVPYWDVYIEEARNVGLKLLAWNVWDKLNPGSIGQQKYMFPLRHEFIFVFGEKLIVLNKSIHKHGKPDRRQFTSRRQKDGSMRLSTTKNDTLEPMKRLESIITHHSQKAPPFYQPAQMPVYIPEEYIKACTHEGEYVCDPFGGSGTTLIACERTNRKCFIMEINPKYCENIIQRYTKLKGELFCRL